jgi:hypothetical protein
MVITVLLSVLRVIPSSLALILMKEFFIVIKLHVRSPTPVLKVQRYAKPSAV